MNSKTVGRLAAAILALLGAFALGAVSVPLVVQQDDPPPDVTTMPEVGYLSGEAYQGCLLLGMDDAGIREDPGACLSAYWTPERLRRSPLTRQDWNDDNGVASSCDDKGLCNLDAGLDDPPLPPDASPWWAEQALRHPGRTTGLTDVLAR